MCVFIGPAVNNTVNKIDIYRVRHRFSRPCVTALAIMTQLYVYMRQQVPLGKASSGIYSMFSCCLRQVDMVILELHVSGTCI